MRYIDSAGVMFGAPPLSRLTGDGSSPTPVADVPKKESGWLKTGVFVVGVVVVLHFIVRAIWKG